jgi:HlyD family secretion protein
MRATASLVASSLLVAALLAGTAGCKKKDAPQATASQAPAVLTVSTEPVGAARMADTIELTGGVAAWDQLPIMPGVNGLRITQVLLDEGQVAAKGQLLAQLDDAAIRAQLAQAKARLLSAQANVAQAEDAHRRFASLSAEGGVSASEMTQRRTAVDTARAQLAEAQAAIGQFEVQLAQTRVTAPESGLVIKRDAHLGDVSAVGKPLFTLVRDNRLELQALAPEAYLGRIRAGQSAEVSSDALPGLKVLARVRDVAPAVEAQSRQATVRITLPPRSGFKVGMFARAQIELGAQQVLAVPAGAVVSQADGSAVFVLDGRQARLRKVSTGTRQGDRVAITQGLTPGERVVINGVGFLKDGDLVDVAESPASGAAEPAVAPAPAAASGAPGAGH